ncbi:MAG: ABC-three component system protein [Desulfitobacteriaceae bacterium]
MERDFRYLRDEYTDEGAREMFERICTQWLYARFGTDAHRIKVNRGDSGIDVLIGDFSQPIDVYQCKYFIDEIGDSQKQQIRESYEQAKSAPDFQMQNWYLCLPRELNTNEFKWWSYWKKRKEPIDQIPMYLCEGSYLIGELKKHEIYNEAFNETERQMLEEIRECLLQEKMRIFDEIIAWPIEDDQLYEDMVFVKKLESANVRTINGCKRDYFNAELAWHSIQSKGIPENIRIYKQLKQKIYSFWENQYRQYQDENYGNTLLAKTYERIEDNDTTALQSIAAINLLAKKGMLHQLADDCSIGWLKDYQVKLEEYLKSNQEVDGDAE